MHPFTEVSDAVPLLILGTHAQVRDGERVMVCLKRALKIAHAAQQQLAIALKSNDTTPASLFVEVLNHYLYYYDQGLALISSSVLQVCSHLHAVPCFEILFTVAAHQWHHSRMPSVPF